MVNLKERIVFLIIFVLLMVFSVVSPAEDTKDGEDTPGWLKRTEFSFQYETDQHPIFYLQTVQPFYQAPDKVNTFFYQPRVSLSGGDFTYNLGAGYRKLVDDDLLLGINVFGDYEDLHEHGRIGIGAEALRQILEARFNAYFGITTKRVVEDTASSTTYERVPNGLDFELGSPLPYMPWLKLYGSGFWYDFDKFDDKYGWKTRIEARPTDTIRLEFYTWDDNKGEQEYGGRLRFNLEFGALTDFRNAFRMADEPFPKKDLKKEMLIPVERNFNIVVEKWTESGTMTIEVGRGT